MTSGTTKLPRPHAFTLIELLLVVGIIGLLMGLLLPAVTKAWGRSVKLRTQADLAAITTALEAYKSDWGSYPLVTNGNSGAAVLGKALIGSADAAHFWDTTAASLSTVKPGDIQTTMMNPVPPTYNASKTYQAGDIVTTGGSMPSLNDFLAGTQSTIFVCVRSDTQADGKPHSPTGNVTNDFWWALFLPYDGNDGAGSKIRLGAAPDTNGRMTTAVGRTYGPYIEADRFKTRGTTLLDRNDSPILYFPVNAAADPALAGGLAVANTYPPAPNVRSFINVNDNIGAFVNETAATPETAAAPTARIAAMLGDYNLNGKTDTGAMVNEPKPPKASFLLWTAGADRRFGPPGQASTAAGSWVKGDLVLTPSTAVDQTHNKQSVDACDDVTNFAND